MIPTSKNCFSIIYSINMTFLRAKTWLSRWRRQLKYSHSRAAALSQCSLGTARAFSNKSFCDNDRCVPAGENRGKVVSIAFPAVCSSGGMAKSEFYSCASNLWLTQSLEIIVTLAAMTRPNCVCMFYLFSIHFLALPSVDATAHGCIKKCKYREENTMPHIRTSFSFLNWRFIGNSLKP
jgi:hypothetical protein